MASMGKTFKRCGCRNGQGRRLEQHCPRLAERGHGSWYFHCCAPNLFGRSERVRRGGFSSQTAVRAARDEHLADSAARGADQARRFTDAMFKLGAIDEDGAATGDMPNLRPGPHVVPDALVDTMTSEHVGTVTAFYHRAYQGDVRGLLGRLADWNEGVADALLRGEKVPPCVYCGADHSPPS